MIYQEEIYIQNSLSKFKLLFLKCYTYLTFIPKAKILNRYDTRL
ncbi:hypothetical protein F898_02496 [Acinetobacter courvalinii]|nr:hypothetical protein F898_02496 [Acinetobacter courvalinii]